jgi:hypothetical protein
VVDKTSGQAANRPEKQRLSRRESPMFYGVSTLISRSRKTLHAQLFDRDWF